MKILITNDDGIASPNLKLLTETVKLYYPNDKIIVVAPSEEQSAVSHALDIKKQKSIKKINDLVEGVDTYIVNSTPAECVILTSNVLYYDFDIVFSGINNGLNLGIDVMYSGTCGAALEALNYCDFSVAFSCHVGTCEGFLKARDEIFTIIKNNKFNKTCLNINYPKNPQGIKVTCQKNQGTDLDYQKHLLNDVDAINQDYISITPLHLDLTEYLLIDKINEVLKYSCKK